jgi:hypothetical protein
MASIDITPSELIVRIHGWDKILAMRATLRIPLVHIIRAQARPREAYFDDVLVETWRGIGTYVRGKLAAGLVYLPDGPCFYDVHDASRAISIDVRGEPIHRVVVQIDGESPDEAVRRIERTIDARWHTARAASWSPYKKKDTPKENVG